MADFLARPAGTGPDGVPPRQTLAVDQGHQIRLTVRTGSSDKSIRLSCRCQTGRIAPWAVVAADTISEMWAQYNRLPHDPAAGPFTPVDTSTGLLTRAATGG